MIPHQTDKLHKGEINYILLAFWAFWTLGETRDGIANPKTKLPGQAIPSILLETHFTLACIIKTSLSGLLASTILTSSPLEQ